MSMPYDPRTTAIQGDLASMGLQGLIAAKTYQIPIPMQVSAPVVPIRAAPEGDAEQWDQMIFGEGFDLLAEADGFGWGQARRDGYVGYVDLAALSAPVLAPTHKISALRTYGFSEPSIKSAPIGLYSLNALVTVEAREGRFVRAARAGWFVESQLSPIGQFETDPVAVAERFLGAPYQWGGRESLGLDCSGLVQQAFYACGLACPRDSDMQMAAIGTAVDGTELRRGDLVFWKGHVGLMKDAITLLHANAHHMAVVSEPLAAAILRIEAAGSGSPTAFRRP
jgi:cell wall-associated NlpC family hydrolase